ncbi:hypothetical protein DERF_016694 [Dermatophagoides farinae]|uniref:Uncharacterized protein n=1 Tax=Dermatophagoides farinae TaxID=6954 RepID=A0A922HME6_DERFA|nr:hypothetical protein DERF_016694 [Dermatophagoides farinae]
MITDYMNSSGCVYNKAPQQEKQDVSVDFHCLIFNSMNNNDNVGTIRKIVM